VQLEPWQYDTTALVIAASCEDVSQSAVEAEDQDIYRSESCWFPYKRFIALMCSRLSPSVIPQFSSMGRRMERPPSSTRKWPPDTPRTK
jgi:hypothetical protein